MGKAKRLKKKKKTFGFQAETAVVMGPGGNVLLYGIEDDLLLMIAQALLRIGHEYGDAIRFEVVDKHKPGERLCHDDIACGLTPMSAGDAVNLFKKAKESARSSRAA